MRSAGKGLLALPALPYLFVFWIIPFEIASLRFVEDAKGGK